MSDGAHTLNEHILSSDVAQGGDADNTFDRLAVDVLAEKMKKLVVYLILVLIGVCVAGIYGALHNQISFTVSSEYFTEFKFQQFGIADSQIPERLRASYVGFLASWWMGIPVGLLIGLVGFIHKGHQRMLAVSFRAIIVAVLFTFLFGLCGLLYGVLQTRSLDLAVYDYWYVPESVTDLRRFLCAVAICTIPLIWAGSLLLLSPGFIIFFRK